MLCANYETPKGRPSQVSSELPVFPNLLPMAQLFNAFTSDDHMVNIKTTLKMNLRLNSYYFF